MRPTGAAALLGALLLSPPATSREVSPSPVWRWLEPVPLPGHSALVHDGRRFVRLGWGYVALSHDGVLWSTHPTELRGNLAIAWNGGELMATTANGVAASADGLTWTDWQLPPEQQLLGVTWAGDRWVAVGQAFRIIGGTVTSVAATATLSPDRQWDVQLLPDWSSALRGVAWNGDTLVAFGVDGMLLASADGVAWERRELPSTVLLHDVVWAGDRWVAVGLDGGACALTSTDGIAWVENRLGGDVLGLSAVAWTGSELVALELSSSEPVSRVFLSADGVEWTAADLDTEGRHLSAVAQGGDTTLVVGPDLAVASHDRQSWSWLSRSVGPWAPNQIDAVSSGDGLLSLGMDLFGTVFEPVILRSEDGLRFRVERPSGLEGRHLPLEALAWGSGHYLTVGPLAWAVSDDGLTWSTFAVAPGAALEQPLRGATWAGDRFVAVGDHGSVAWSSDGETWTVASPPPGSATLRAVAAGGGVVVAVGDDGAGVTTADWTAWQPWSTGTASDLTAIAWGDGRFVAVGGGGTVATSGDGLAWQVQTLPSLFPFADVAWTANGFVAVSADGTFTSRDGLAWTLVPPEPALTGTTCGAHAAVVPWHTGAVIFDGAEVLGLDWSSPAEVAGGEHAWVVPAAAHADGLAGTRWRSDLLLSSSGREPALLDMVLLERARDNTAARPRTNTLLPGTTARLADLVRDTFGADAAAGAVMIGSSAALVVDSRTSNHGGAGTYGQRVPAVPVGEALQAGELAVLPGLGRDARRRTNLGAVSLSASPTTVRFELFAGNGDPLGEVDLELPPFGSGQRSDPLADLGELPDAYAVAWSPSPDARFVPYASVVDASTGDPAYVRPTSACDGEAVVPAVASLPGAGGTFWRSDLALVNLGASAATVRLELVPRDLDGTGDLPTASITVPPGQQLVIADLVGTLFGVTAAGALHLDVEQGEVVASSRTWTASGEGSFGQDVPAIPAEEAVRSGEAVVLVGLAECCDPTSGFRSNLGLVNLSLAPITVTVAASHGDGTPIGSLDLEVPANSNIQRDRILAALGACEVRTGVLTLSSTTPDARFLAYASVVDNATGDPIFVTPPPATAAR